MKVKWSLLLSFQCTLLVCGLTCLAKTKEEKISTYEYSMKDGSGSLVYGCKAGKEVGPCVDSVHLCTSQKGHFVGYCFYNGVYEGVCCPGLDPSHAVLTTPPTLADETGTGEAAPAVTGPSLPTVTAPSVTGPSVPTVTAPTVTAPTVTAPTVSAPTASLPTATAPTAPSLPTVTAPTVTAPTLATPSLPTVTAPSAPSLPEVTGPQLPQATGPSLPEVTGPTLPEVTGPQLPEATGPTLPEVTGPQLPEATGPSLPEVTGPTLPEVTGPQLPEATGPSLPEVTGPQLPEATGPSLPEVTGPTLPEVTGPQLPEATGPSLPEVTGPSLPEVTGPQLPEATGPSLPEVTGPSLPEVTGPQLPEATGPSLPEVTGPQLPEATGPSLPEVTGPQLPEATGPSLPEVTGPQLPEVTGPQLPEVTSPPSLGLPGHVQAEEPVTSPAVTSPNLPTVTVPTVNAPTLPPAPAVTTPALPSAPTLPPVTGATLPDVTTPALPTATSPSLPDVTTPALPTAPTLPDVTGPSLPSATTADVTTPALPTLPSVTGPTLPDASSPSLPEVTGPTLPDATGPTLPDLTGPDLPDLTGPTLPPVTGPNLPEATGPTLPSVTGTLPPAPELPTVTAPTVAPGDSPYDAPAEISSDCSTKSKEKRYILENPAYPNLDTETKAYQHVVFPLDDTCAVRFEFIDVLMVTRDGCCPVDSIRIIGVKGGPTVPICGRISGYEVTERINPNQPVRVIITAQSGAHLWKIGITQIPCTKIPSLQSLESKHCGIRNTNGKKSFDPFKTNDELVKPDMVALNSRQKFLVDKILQPPGEPTEILETLMSSRRYDQSSFFRGNLTDVNEWPWQALLLVEGRPICGATLITQEYAVTSAHCVFLNMKLPLGPYLTIDLGDHDLSTTHETSNKVIRVVKIIPNIRFNNVDNDIALVKLATRVEPSENISPVCFPTTDNAMVTDRSAMVTGWSRTEFQQVRPILRESNVTIISNKDCRNKWSTVVDNSELIKPSMTCATSSSEDTSTCNRDSGNPLVIEENGKWRLIGVSTFGSLRGCSVPGIPSVFTRLTSFLDWMIVNMASP